MAVAIGHQGCQQLDLVFGPQHRGMGTVQVVKMTDQAGNARGHVKRLQHVMAHKISQVAHRLHRHRLVKQLQRLLTQATKQPPEQGAVRGKSVKHGGAAFAQTFL